MRTVIKILKKILQRFWLHFCYKKAIAKKQKLENVEVELICSGMNFTFLSKAKLVLKPYKYYEVLDKLSDLKDWKNFLIFLVSLY